MKEIIGELNILLVMGRELVNKGSPRVQYTESGNEIKKKKNQTSGYWVYTKASCRGNASKASF